MLAFAIGDMISAKGKMATEQESEAEEQTESDLDADEEYPFNTMSQDWSGEDMEGFCYHEISDECKAAGGKFPVMAQIYTYIVCQNYGVDYEMVFALIEQESECNWNASGDGGTSWGYMQMAQKWHKERMQRLNCTDLTNPYQNVTVGIDYLKEIQDSLQEVPEDVRPYYVLAVYNYGAAGAKENLWNHGVYKYSYNTAIMERAEGRERKTGHEGGIKVDNKKRLCLEDAVTNAEIYAVKVIEEELNRKGIVPNSIERKIIITRTADVLAAHREEVRDMYKKSGLLLQDWIIKMSGIKDLIAFKKMKQLGYTGDVMQDMKKMEEAR